MEPEVVDPLQLLVQSVTKQQQRKSDLVNRLNQLNSELARHDNELTSLNLEEKTLRLQLANIKCSNIELGDKNSSALQTCEMERQNRSSLALTLDSLNEKSRTLEVANKRKKKTYDNEINKIQDKLHGDGESLADLLNDPG